MAEISTGIKKVQPIRLLGSLRAGLLLKSYDHWGWPFLVRSGNTFNGYPPVQWYQWMGARWNTVVLLVAIGGC